jgi:hypothetical protein
METFVCLVKDLPDSLIRALESVSYKRKDIHVTVKDTESISVSGGSGYRGFCVIVDLSTGQRETLIGSWGGANMFSPENRVDMDTQSRVLGNNVVVIKGSTGGDRPVYATITIGHKNVVPMLPIVELALKDRQILYCFSLKAGYRKQELESIHAEESEIESLITRGYLKKDGRGIIVTIAGKNVNAGKGGYGMPRALIVE